MIISRQKTLDEILESLQGCQKVFLVGCGECATACKSGGEAEVALIKQELEKRGKTVCGMCVPSAPCVAAKLKTEMAKSMQAARDAEALLVFACGLGVQSVKDNDRLGKVVLPGCDTICAAVMDAKGDFFEKCSMCNQCVLDETEGICPVTLCPKGIMNGPCGGMNKGKCEVDNDKDCVWVLIYNELQKKNKLSGLNKIRRPRDYKKSLRPHKVLMGK